MNAIKEYLNGLEVRERNLILIAVFMFALVVPYQFIWKPFIESIENNNVRVQSQKAQFVKMQQQAGKIKHLRGAGNITSQSGKQFLNNLIQTAAKRNGLANTLKIKSEDQNNIRVSMDNVPFDSVMNWLDQLVSNNGVIVTKLNIDRQPTLGRVNVSVYLEAP